MDQVLRNFHYKKIHNDDILNEVTICIGTNHNPDILKMCKFNYIIDQFNLENIRLIHCNQTNSLQYDFVIVGTRSTTERRYFRLF